MKDSSQLVQIQNPQPETPRKAWEELHRVSLQPFVPNAHRGEAFEAGGITTTEVCNLTCVMCHFNGPKSVRKDGVLQPRQVEKYLQQLPHGTSIWFAATGEFFMDSNATTYLRRARDLGLTPCVLTNGQLWTTELMDEVLEAGVRIVRMSVDSSDAELYRKIRRGAELYKILEACSYFREKKRDYPGLLVEIGVTVLKNAEKKRDEMTEFWRGKVDAVYFNAEYFDTFRFRNPFFIPEKRCDCPIKLYLLPSGHIAPCCAMQVYQHTNDVSWLPHIDTHSLEEAHSLLSEMYEDPSSPLGKLCGQCDWWILYSPNEKGETPYLKYVHLEDRFGPR